MCIGLALFLKVRDDSHAQYSAKYDYVSDGDVPTEKLYKLSIIETEIVQFGESYSIQLKTKNKNKNKTKKKKEKKKKRGKIPILQTDTTDPNFAILKKFLYIIC